MNRSILIVICDFLLVSLLVFSTVDINNVAEEGRTRTLANVNVATNEPSSGRDLAAAMRTALEEERQQREQLSSELSRARQTAQTSAQTALQLQQERARLQQQYATAETNLQSLNQQLQASSTQATISNEKLLALEAELQHRQEEAAALEKQLSQLSQSNQFALTEKQRLANQLQIAEVEKRNARELASTLQEQVKAERAEKAQLAAGVQALATNSSKLVQEIRENRPLAANMIYSGFVSNSVQANVTATRAGIFGIENTKRLETKTVLMTDGQNIFAISHVSDTPFVFWTPGTDWDNLSGTLTHDSVQTTIHSLSFEQRDPRIVFIPVSDTEAKQLGVKIYRTSNDPYKFQDAVLVGTSDNYYGECRFEIDATMPGYVRLDRSVLRGLFGKFNPSRGDLVLSRQGELLGIMANDTYCLMLNTPEPIATFQFGNASGQHTGETLSALYAAVMRMPGKLQ